MLTSKNSGAAFIIAIAVQYLLQIILLSFVAVTQTVLVAIYIVNAFSIFVGAFLGSFGKNYNPFKTKNKVSGKSYALFGASVVGTMCVGLALANFFIYALQQTGYMYSGYSLELNSVFGIISSIIVILVLPPIVEEYLMRGVILSGLKRTGYVKAIFLCALMFMFLHQSPMQTVHQFLLGALLAYGVIVTRSIWIAVFGHFFNNFISLGISIYESNAFDEITTTVTLDTQTICILLALLVGGAIILFFSLRGFTRQVASERAINSNKPIGEYDEIIHSKDSSNKKLENMLGWFDTDSKEEITVKKERIDIYMWLAIGIGVALWIFNLVNGYVQG